MNHTHPTRARDQQQMDRLRDQAYAKAAALRSEAMTSFWGATWRWLSRAPQSEAKGSTSHCASLKNDLSGAH